jgi:hypothetical protein
MKKIITILFVLVGFSGFSQKNRASISLGKKQDVSQILRIGADGGFLLHVSETYAGREKNSEIYCYSPDLKKKWSVKINNPTNALLEEYLVASAFSTYAYYIQQIKSDEYVITRISDDGKRTTLNYKIIKELFDVSKIAIYTDQKGLNIIANKTIKVKKGEKAKSEIQILQMRHDQKKFELIKTEIKDFLSDDEEDVFIEFLGHDDNNIYLAQKFVNVNENSIKYKMYTVDKEGYRVIEEDEFLAEIKNELVASTNQRTTDGSPTANKDYRVVVSTSTSYSGPNGTPRTTTTYTYYANAGSYGCAKLDIASGKFIIYGLVTDKKFVRPKADKKGKMPAYELKDNLGGAYLISFDVNTGEKVWDEQVSIDKAAVAEVSKSKFYSRSIWLDVMNDNCLRLGITAGLVRKNKNAEAYSLLIKKNTKQEFKKIEFPARSGETNSHIRMVSNLLLSKSIAPSEAISFGQNPQDIRTKHYSKFGLLLPNKIILFQNYAFSKTPKIDIFSYDINKQ